MEELPKEHCDCEAVRGKAMLSDIKMLEDPCVPAYTYQLTLPVLRVSPNTAKSWCVEGIRYQCE